MINRHNLGWPYTYSLTLCTYSNFLYYQELRGYIAYIKRTYNYDNHEAKYVAYKKQIMEDMWTEEMDCDMKNGCRAVSREAYTNRTCSQWILRRRFNLKFNHPQGTFNTLCEFIIFVVTSSASCVLLLSPDKICVKWQILFQNRKNV